MVNPLRRFAVSAAACATTLSIVSGAFAPGAHGQSSQSNTAQLAGAVARAQSEVDQLSLGIGDLQEGVNRALVDLRDAQTRAEQARRGSDEASKRLEAAEAEVKAARKALDEVTRSQYRGANQSGALKNVSGGQKEALERTAFLRQRSAEKQAALDAVEQARVEAANEAARAREAADLADTAEADAAQAEADARALLDDNLAELEARNAELASAQAELSAAEASLAEVRPGETGAERAVEVAAPAPVEVSEEEVAAVQARVAELVPDAPAPSSEVIAQAVATARATDAVEGATDPVEEASAIAAASTLVEHSQSPHATFADPYAGLADGSSGSSTSTVIAALDVMSSVADGNAVNPASAGELISAFSEGLRSGLESAGAPRQISDVLPEVITPERISQAIQTAVPQSNAAAVEVVIARAKSQIGTPYVWGGGDANGPTTGVNGGSVRGYDCSGLVLYAFAGVGISLPHYTGYQYQRGTQIDPSQAKRGDLLFWGPGGSQHVAIYLGDGTMIEAPQTGMNVQVSPVRWANMSPKAVRLL